MGIWIKSGYYIINLKDIHITLRASSLQIERNPDLAETSQVRNSC